MYKFTSLMLVLYLNLYFMLFRIINEIILTFYILHLMNENIEHIMLELICGINCYFMKKLQPIVYIY